MLRWEQQPEGNWYAYSGQVVVGMVVKLARPLDGGQTHVWQLSKVHSIFGWKHNGHSKSAGTGKRSLGIAWKNWCEACGLQPIAIEQP